MNEAVKIAMGMLNTNLDKIVDDNGRVYVRNIKRYIVPVVNDELQRAGIICRGYRNGAYTVTLDALEKLGFEYNQLFGTYTRRKE